MVPKKQTVDLLNPIDFYRQNYIHQLSQTIAAYSDSMIVIGEALQNAIDAVCGNSDISKGAIDITIDFDSNSITVRDNGIGFPSDLNLLYLGGTQKVGKQKKGKIGVGIKVVFFSTEYFCIRTKNEMQSWKIEISNAHNFKELTSLEIPQELPADPTPLTNNGTEVTYRFKENTDEKNRLDLFMDEMIFKCLPRGVNVDFGNSIQTLNTGYPSPICALIASYMGRFSYAGDVRVGFGDPSDYPIEGIDINFKLICSDPKSRLSNDLYDLFGDESEQSFSIRPGYMLVDESLKWVLKGKKAPEVFNDKLGVGGTGLSRTDGFNKLIFLNDEEFKQFESILINRNGKTSNKIGRYKKRLFPLINGMIITIGRIPDFDSFLPGGSRRLISCNGVVTDHDIGLERGRNQEYVRCLDLVIDLDADLNYGKNQLTNMHLVALVKDYINEAYTRVLQSATGTWVGKLPKQGDEDTEVFVGRKDLDLEGYISRKIPSDENDVIGLYFEMAGKGVFDSYYIFGLSQISRYDCRAAIKREDDPDSVFEPTDDTQLRIVEFKVHAADVITEFERGQKIANEIDLIIAWDEGSNDSSVYKIYDINQSDAYKSSPKRVFPNVSKYIYDARSGSEVQIVLLQDISNELKDKGN